MKTTFKPLLACGAMALSTAAFAGGEEETGADKMSKTPDNILLQIFEEGTPYLDARYRYEFIDQDSLAEKAHASTLRTRLGFETGEYEGVSGVIEFENITQLGSDNYNDTLNGRTDHPTVADPESTEVNQVYVQYIGIPDSTIKLGRQRLNLDNQRFIGSVGWRQNDQTLDAVTLKNTTIPDTTMLYGYVSNVNRIFGEDSTAGDWESQSHLFNVQNTTLLFGTLTGYAYLLDFEDDSPANSSNTYGASFKGKYGFGEKMSFNYYLEYATQIDAGDNTTDYDADYYHIAPGFTYGGLTVTLGYEVLGSDNGTYAFRTPLATGHKFNGWTDKFLNTPNSGIEDMYISLTYKLKGLEGNTDFLNGLIIKAHYHDFSAEEGSADYGKEYAVYTKLPFLEHYFVEAKYAHYDADTVSSDTDKIVFGLGVKF